MRSERLALRGLECDRYHPGMGRGVIRSDGTRVLVDVLVVPNASRRGVVGLHGDHTRVRFTAPPDRGRANAAVEALLRSETGARAAEIVAGHGARTKTVALAGVDVATVRGRLTREP